MNRPDQLTGTDCAVIAACAASRAGKNNTNIAGEIDTVYAFLAIGADVLGRSARAARPLLPVL